MVWGLLRALSRRPLVIFTTAHPDNALDAFNLDAVDYLVKPFTFEILMKAINKAVLMLKGKIQHHDNEYSFIRSDGKYHRLRFDEIIFC
jgi:DNA-binding LytR/AlgR family response regulator